MPSTQTKIRFSEKKKTPLRNKLDTTKERSQSSKTRSTCNLNVSEDENERSCSLERRFNRKRSSDPHRDEENTQSSPTKRELTDKGERTSSLSPSSHLSKLDISCSDELVTHSTNRKSLFGKELCYIRARQALHSSVPSVLPGREEQIQELTEYLSVKLHSSSSGSLYISGPPGTGKTACLSNILTANKFQEYRSIYVNCTSMRSSESIYSRICEELNLKVKSKSEKKCLEMLEEFWSSNKRMTLLVLDEMDQLESKRQTVLYTIFEWPSKPEVKLVLIGIANALDLTDRILPRLQAHVRLKPKLMHFAPYTKDQIAHILTERLSEMDVLDVFSPVALQLLAGKVASVSGDVRRALDIGRRVLELAEAQKLPENGPLKPTSDHSSNTSSPRKKGKDSAVDLKVVMDVLDSVYSTSQMLTNATSAAKGGDSFPLQQKILVCSLLLVLKKGKNKDVTVGNLHEIYRKICKRRNLTPVDIGEFVSLCQLVETRGILQLQMKKEARMAKIRLLWDEQEVDSALQDKHLLAAILNDPHL